MARIVIIGAGLTGLSAAYHLEKKGFFDYEIFEKESTTGGLCRSVQQDGFTFDFTGHLLHISDPYFRSMIESLVGFDQLNAITRRSYIYSQNTYTRYPYQINLYGLPSSTIAACIEGYVTRPRTRKKPVMFTDWVMHHFGKGFARHFFYPYQKKIFACPVRELTADWTGRFVPSTSLTQIIEGALSDIQESVGYNAQFFYPKEGGIISWVDKIADHVKRPIRTEYAVDTIDTRSKVVHFTNGHHEPYEQLITTMPLDILLGLLKEKPARFYRQARQHLRCNSVINFNLGISRADLSDKHWIYFPESEFPFYRLGFPHNFATSMTPPGCSSLYGEFAHLRQSSSWVHSQLKHSLTATKKILHIDDKEIMTEKVITIPHAYVIYDQWRKKHLPSLLKTLEHDNIHSVGRYGEWKYASMQEAVLDGKKIAENLVVMPATKSWIMPEQSQTTHKSSMVHT